jgi:hypothetical protein
VPGSVSAQAAEPAQRIRAGDRINLDYTVQEKKKFGQFSCQGGATVVRATCGHTCRLLLGVRSACHSACLASSL